MLLSWKPLVEDGTDAEEKKICVLELLLQRELRDEEYPDDGSKN